MPYAAGLVLVTGATGATGGETVRALVAAGHRVAAVGRNADRLAELAATVDSDRLTTHVGDVTDAAATRDLVAEVHEVTGTGIDGLVHLVGGWRGGTSFADNTEEDWAVLSSALVDTLRHTTLALHDDLVASPAGRVVIVSAASVATPQAGNANYVAAKAAAEAWMGSLADSFAKAGDTAAAVVAVIGWIGTGKTATTPEALAAGLVDIIDGDATRNGTRVDLRPQH